MKSFFLFIPVFLMTVGCSSITLADTNRMHVELVISQCQSEIEKRTNEKLSKAVDYIYVHEFEAGYSMIFSHGSVGTFGQRSKDQRGVWSCGVVGENIVYLGSIREGALIDELDQQGPLEDYSQDVKEYLYIRSGDNFKFCCMQFFDENNMDKHNPNFFDRE